MDTIASFCTYNYKSNSKLILTISLFPSLQGNIIEGLYGLSSFFTSKKNRHVTYTFSKWKTMIAVKLQMEADVNYARKIYKKFSKDRETLIELLNEKERKKTSLFKLDSNRSDLQSTRNAPLSTTRDSHLDTQGTGKIKLQALGGQNSRRQTPTKLASTRSKSRKTPPSDSKTKRKKNKELYQHLKEYFMKALQGNDAE